MKLGNFAVSFTDLTIPVAGIPISVTRSYDTVHASRDGQLGYGWTLSFGDADLRVDFAPGATVGWGGYTAFLDGTRVFVTFPGGDRQGFTFTPVSFTPMPGVTWYAPAFTPDPGNLYALSVPNITLNRTESGEYYFIGNSGLVTYNPAHPEAAGVYDVIDIAGTKSLINATTGQLQSVEDRKGNRLDYTSGAIVSNRLRPDNGLPLAVTLERDPRGRITAITDPRGNSVRYAYDANGDLVAVTDRMNQTTQITYKSPTSGFPAHYVDTIIDALGRTALTASYNDGTSNPANKFRLSALTDAAGNSAALDYNTSNPNAVTQSILDPENALLPGQPKTTVTFDEIGNVTQAVTPTGQTSLIEYNDTLPKNLYSPTKTTQVVGAPGGGDDIVSTVQYDARGFPVQTTDPEGNSSYMTYDDFGMPLSASDAAGNTVHNTYDDVGNLTYTASPLSAPSSFSYDATGNMLTATVSGGAAGTTTTSFTYDSLGRRVTTTSPQVNAGDAPLVTSAVYDLNGNQTSSSYVWINPDNPNDTRTVTSTTVFDANDRAYQSVDPEGNVSSTEFDLLDRPFRSTDIFGKISETIYDSRGQVIESRSPLGTVTRTVYDKNGRALWTVDSHFAGQQAHGSHSIYDSAGRVTTSERWSDVVIDIVTNPDGS